MLVSVRILEWISGISVGVDNQVFAGRFCVFWSVRLCDFARNYDTTIYEEWQQEFWPVGTVFFHQLPSTWTGIKHLFGSIAKNTTAAVAALDLSAYLLKTARHHVRAKQARR